MKAPVALLTLCLAGATVGAAAVAADEGAVAADARVAGAAGTTETAGAARASAAAAAGTPLHPRLAPARWPVAVDAPALPPASQLAALARQEPA